MPAIGKHRWVIAEGYIPSQSVDPDDPALVSHETACILNTGDKPARVGVTLFFKDREPVGPYLVTVSPRRTLHMRFNDLDDPEPVPRDMDYSAVIEADVPIVVQHTRLDSRRAEIALMTTMAWPDA